MSNILIKVLRVTKSYVRAVIQYITLKIKLRIVVKLHNQLHYPIIRKNSYFQFFCPELKQLVPSLSS